MKFYIFSLLFSLNLLLSFGQTVYKTPSGSKYHTASCRYVKNVSNKLSISEAKSIGLTPCSQCNPTKITSNNKSTGLGIRVNEAKGVSSRAVQCRGRTKSGVRCKRMTKNKNGYCFQHEQ